MHAPGGSDPHPCPSPALTPDDVVAAQLAGLAGEPRHDSGAGPGMQTVWAFASPGNRAATGPANRFAEMLRSPAYVGLLEHRAAQQGPALVEGDGARQEVLVITQDDRAQGFTWVLARQGDGCWLTDGVLRHPDEGERG